MVNPGESPQPKLDETANALSGPESTKPVEYALPVESLPLLAAIKNGKVITIESLCAQDPTHDRLELASAIGVAVLQGNSVDAVCDPVEPSKNWMNTVINYFPSQAEPISISPGKIKYDLQKNVPFLANQLDKLLDGSDSFTWSELQESLVTFDSNEIAVALGIKVMQGWSLTWQSDNSEFHIIFEKPQYAEPKTPPIEVPKPPDIA